MTSEEKVNLFNDKCNQLNIEQVIELLPGLFDLPGKLVRFEVIDSSGRVYVHKSNNVKQLSFQDEGKTLKVFLK